MSGFDDPWRITVGGASRAVSDLKKKPIIGCGPKALTDISSPATRNDYRQSAGIFGLHSINAKQCRAKSSIGMACVKCPYVTRHSDPAKVDDIYTGLEFAHEPSLMLIAGNAGFARRFYTAAPNVTGNNPILVGDFFKPAGTQCTFWNAVTHPGGRVVPATSAGYADVIRQLAKVPKSPIEGQRTDVNRLRFQVGAGPNVTHARVKFGNNPEFECNKNYATACYTDATITPYAL